MRLQAIIGKQKFKPKKSSLSEIKEIQTLLSSGRFGRISTTDKQTLAEINNSELTAKDKFYIDFFDLNDISVVYSDLTQKGYTIIDSKLIPNKNYLKKTIKELN